MKLIDKKTIEKRIEIAIRAARPGSKRDLSVSHIAKLANVSRSLLYSKYPGIVAQLRTLANSPGRRERMQNEIALLRQQNSALAQQCVELKLALNRALDRLDVLSNSKKVARSTKV